MENTGCPGHQRLWKYGVASETFFLSFPYPLLPSFCSYKLAIDFVTVRFSLVPQAKVGKSMNLLGLDRGIGKAGMC